MSVLILNCFWTQTIMFSSPLLTCSLHYLFVMQNLFSIFSPAFLSPGMRGLFPDHLGWNQPSPVQTEPSSAGFCRGWQSHHFWLLFLSDLLEDEWKNRLSNRRLGNRKQNTIISSASTEGTRLDAWAELSNLFCTQQVLLPARPFSCLQLHPTALAVHLVTAGSDLFHGSELLVELNASA